MSKKILIDAAIQEETRLLILQGQKVEVFETETQSEVKGNIYLARITRVEPSLQAAFVEYGGNRHGFLAFPEIHTDYFQIPAADRTDEAPEGAPEGAPDEASDEASDEAPKEVTSDAPSEESPDKAPNAMDDLMPESQGDDYYYNVGKLTENQKDESMPQTVVSDKAAANNGNGGRNNNIYKKYNIQEVIKRGQLLLIQVVKEERGNKGAALTTFLSLAGRYCVLMPNTDSAGGVSRKLNHENRNKIRDLVDELDVPAGMSLIVRTAGAQQAKADIERDFEYLTRLWGSIRELTLESTAPALVYEEGNLVQRALRDFVKKDTKEIHIEGAAAFQKAKQYMEQLMPAQLEMLSEHKEAQPIFVHYGAEDLLDDMLQPTVQLKSGGYIVINPTEALVAIDVNSGKATSEHNIEDTAYKTNLEAAEEISRQAKLRDLGGLIVIDFIDMENGANIRDIEKRMRDSVRSDRAKVQTGRISQNFGLLEMSRQRLRPEISEGRTENCPECKGSGQILTPQTIALRALREGVALANKTGKNREVILRLNWPVVLFLLNERKDELLRIEQDQGLKLRIEAGGIDNPDKPWVLETRKLATPFANDDVKDSAAISMETAYTQMTPPSEQDSSTQPQAPADPANARDGNKQNRNRNRNRNRNHNNHNHNHNHQQKRGGGGGSGSGGGGGYNKRRDHQNKKSDGSSKGKSAAKPSLWNRIMGKKK